MRQTLARCGLALGLLLALHAPAAVRADEKHPGPDATERRGGAAHHDGEKKGDHNPLAFIADLGLWSLVVFVLLLLILRKWAWGPILQGLQTREQAILGSVEEARRTREDMERMRTQFRAELDAAHAQIPALMDEARRDAAAMVEKMRKEATDEIQAERQRTRRELEVARDQALQELWTQAAQVATLISAKAIGRSLSEDDHRRLVDEAIAEIAGPTPGRG